MPLTVAVQMDPIERIRIAGDSTFALMLEAQARGHALLYYTPDRLCLEGATLLTQAQPLTVKDAQGEHFSLGEARRVDLAEVDVVLLRQDPPFDLAYVTTTHLLERIHPAHAGGQQSARGARRAGEAVRHGLSRADAADADLARSRGDRGVSRPARRGGDEAALRRRRRGGVQGGDQGPEFRFAVRSLLRHLPRTLGHPEIPAGGRHRRQAHHPRRRRAARRGQPRAGRRRHPLQHGSRRRGRRRPSSRRASARFARRSARS